MFCLKKVSIHWLQKKSANRFIFGIRDMFPCTVTLFLGIRENITGQRLQRDPATANLTTSTQSSPSREKSWQKKIMKIPGPEANLRDKTNATPQKKNSLTAQLVSKTMVQIQKITYL